MYTLQHLVAGNLVNENVPSHWVDEFFFFLYVIQIKKKMGLDHVFQEIEGCCLSFSNWNKT